MNTKRYLIKLVIYFFVITFFAFFSSCDTGVDSPVSEAYKDISINVSDHFLDGYFFTAIAFDSRGTAWLGTLNQGLVKYAKGKAEFYNSKNSVLPDSITIWDIAVDQNDVVWIGSSRGLIKFDNNIFKIFNASNSAIPEDVVWSVKIDCDNNLWLASCRFQSGGLVKYNGKNFTLYTPQNSPLPTNMVFDLNIDNNGTKWLLVLNYYSDSYIVRMADDFVRLSSNKWKIFSKADIGYSPSYLGCVVSDIKGYFYTTVTTTCDNCIPHNAIAKYDGANWKIIIPVDVNGKSLGSVNKIFSDQEGNLWAALDGQSGYAIAAYNGKKWIYPSSNFPKTSLFDMAVDGQNKIWLCTGTGIYIIENK